MTTATKTKRTKGDDLYPPKELRENTKARRAWLAAELAKVTAQPNTEAKIVGTGSYQRISVWHLTQVEGRLRQRGVCQCCGNAQVVEKGVLVLHGYKRPGFGYTVGKCPGAGKKPLNVEKTYTEQWYAEAQKDHALAEHNLAAAKAEEERTLGTLYTNGEDNEPGSYAARPRMKDTWRMTPAEKIEARVAYDAAYHAWAQQFPLHAAYEDALKAVSEARDIEFKHRQLKEHFNQLLTANIFGTPLIDEVVT